MHGFGSGGGGGAPPDLPQFQATMQAVEQACSAIQVLLPSSSATPHPLFWQFLFNRRVGGVVFRFSPDSGANKEVKRD